MNSIVQVNNSITQPHFESVKSDCRFIQMDYSNHPVMKLLIFKTNIETILKVKKISSLFAYEPQILDWSVDTEDIDNVLRIEAEDHSSEHEIIKMVETCGLQCEALPD